MGYDTKFRGAFTCSPPLKPEHSAYLKAFRTTRRMKRDPRKAEELPDPEREAVGLPVGDEGGYFVGGSFIGKDDDPSVLDPNTPPDGQPGLWCQWTPGRNGDTIEWDRGEKFYDYCEWLEYLIAHFLNPWGYSLSGCVEWCGEEERDTGEILVIDNKVVAKQRPIDWNPWEDLAF